MKNIYEVNYMNDKNIDERIKNICLQAENNYILNYAKSNEKNIKKNELYNIKYRRNNSNSNSNLLSLDKTLTNSKDSNDNNINKIINENKPNPILINKSIKGYNNQYINIKNNNINNSTTRNNTKINKNKSFNKRIPKTNISQDLINSINSKIKYKSNNMLSLNSFDYKNNTQDDDIVNYNPQIILSQSEINNHNNHIHSKNNSSFFSSDPSFCFECSLHKVINDKNIYNKDLTLKAKENKEINKIILTAKTLLQKNKLIKSYQLLQNYIINYGIKHPDLYYLYGETCRKLKYMEDAQKYLLACMNFKNCSPYVYLSLAELYREIGQFKYSKNFYKKCLLFFEKGNIYYNLAINYMKLNKPLKALNFITEAINMEKNVAIYYKFRSDIYKILGHKDLSEKDIYQYNNLINN